MAWSFTIFILVLYQVVNTGCIQNDTVGLQDGYLNFTTREFDFKLVKDSETLASLQPILNTSFDFLAFDYLPQRVYTGTHQIGDLTLRYQFENASYDDVDSAWTRAPVTPLTSDSPDVLAVADMAPTLPANVPLNVTREWLDMDGNIVLRFNLTNTLEREVHLTSLGIPISINNIFRWRQPEDVQLYCSLADPYIGLDGGYVRVTPVGGSGQALVITPYGKTPFEAWRFLNESQGSIGYQIQTYEGNYEWQIHSLSYAENEWRNATPWNIPTAKTLAPEETYTVGLTFSLSSNIQAIEDAVVSSKTPIVYGIPGYIIPMDMTAELIVNYTSSVLTVDTGGAFTVEAQLGTRYSLTPTGAVWGRSRVTISYVDGKVQTVHYYIIKSAPEAIGDLGAWLTTHQYYTNTSDMFDRAPSIMTFDRQANGFVLQDYRVWIAGLSDDAGAGSYLATAMKQYAQPVATEVAVLDEFIHQTLWGTLQPNGSFGVRGSLFFYQPNATTFNYADLPWNSGDSWNKSRAYTVTRAYNFVHATATYWAMYRVARAYPDLVTQSSWEWYLNQSYQTIQWCLGVGDPNACQYTTDGLMGETVLGQLLLDLGRENWTDQFNSLEDSMRARAEVFNSEADPFGSEQAWDSTGQEGVYYWSNYFGYNSTALKTINSIMGYMPTVAHWGYNGNARRYWDFEYMLSLAFGNMDVDDVQNGGLSGLPLLSYFEQNPDNLYALRVGYGGIYGTLSNIDQAGFASCAFHSYAFTLEWDPYSGDYGPNFSGLTLGHATYILNDPQLGWIAFGGNLHMSNGTITVAPRDALRKRVFIAPMGLKVEIEAGAITAVQFNESSKQVTLNVTQAATSNELVAKSTIVWLYTPGSSVGQQPYIVANSTTYRGGWVVELGEETVQVVIE